MSAPAWESRLRRAAKRQGLTLQKRTPCGALWGLRHGNLLLHHDLSPTEVAKLLHVDLSDWVFPGRPDRGLAPLEPPKNLGRY
jgi:hypothetical protein